jgi:3-oxoacyl-[acyl-carrier-protein] synthase-1
VLPEPSGERVAACIEAALADAGVAPEEVDYVNAHATGTVAGDLAEAAALRRVFGGRIPPVSSTKSLTGHALGAAGAHELIYCLAMMEGGFIAPSINVDHPDPEVADLPLVTAPAARRLDIVVSNSFGFGGTNGVLVLRRAGLTA